MPDVALRIGRLDVGDEEVSRLFGLIGEEERQRAGRFRAWRDRRRFIVRRGRLREWLGWHLGEAPARLAFSANPFGKPLLVGGGIHFSLSHSQDQMMLAIAEVEVGCDIEALDPEIDWPPLAARLFAPGERAALAGMSGEKGPCAFFDCWVRKEAFVKAIGRGLSYPLDAFEVSTGAPAALLGGGRGHRLAAVPGLVGYAGAVAAAGDGAPLRLRITDTGGVTSSSRSDRSAAPPRS